MEYEILFRLLIDLSVLLWMLQGLRAVFDAIVNFFKSSKSYFCFYILTEILHIKHKNELIAMLFIIHYGLMLWECLLMKAMSEALHCKPEQYY